MSGRFRQSEEENIMQTMMIKMTLSITKQCFMECVSSFRDDKLNGSEINCIKSCANRQSGAFIAMNEIQGQLQGKNTQF